MDHKEEKTWGVFISLAGIIGMSIISPVGNIIAVLILWLIKRDQSSFVNEIGREALGFQIVMSIAGFVARVIAGIISGMFALSFWVFNPFTSNFNFSGRSWGLLSIVWIVNVIFSLIAALKANEGVIYKYPFKIKIR